ncbi:MAG TPA: hypothetical protein VJ966_05750, partial [Actinomycetes bacterium]|nr:hypothetical protein [Actinomycetes bacterium]
MSSTVVEDVEQPGVHLHRPKPPQGAEIGRAGTGKPRTSGRPTHSSRVPTRMVPLACTWRRTSTAGPATDARARLPPAGTDPTRPAAPTGPAAP